MKSKTNSIEAISAWFESRPHLSISAIGTSAGIPAGLLSKAIKGEQQLSEKHLPNLIKVLKLYGYK